MEITIAQTRFESVSKHSNDSLLARGNTLRSDEDRLKLDDLMALCTTLQNRVLDLEKQRPLNIMKLHLKRRVKKLEKKNSLGKDASKQWRIDAIDGDEEITMVSVQNVDEEMFDVNVLDEVVEVINSAKLIIDLTTVSVATTTTATITTVDNITLAQALMEIKSTKPKEKGAKIDVDHQLAERLQAQEQEELYIKEKATLFQQLLEKRRKHFAAKRAEEKRNKPLTKAQQRKIMCNYLKNMEGYKLKDLKLKEFNSIQKMFDMAFKRQKVEDDKETTKLKRCLEIIPDEEEVTIDAITLAVKSLTDGKSQTYMNFSQMLKSVDRKDLEDLYKLVKAKYESTRPVEDLDLLLWGDLKTMFESEVEDKVMERINKNTSVDWKLLTHVEYIP
ncbi:hypothetical protein Tco_1245263 [Tanacetum coccineum]